MTADEEQRFPILARLDDGSGQFDLRPFRVYIPMRWGSRAAIALHVLVLTTFYILDVPEIVRFNLISIPLFVLIAYLNERKRPTLAWALAQLEILVHQALCIHYVGWEAGFQYYIVSVSILVFFMPTQRYTLKVFIFGLTCASFAVLNLVYADAAPAYRLNATVLHVIYYLNLCSALGVLGLVTFYYSLAGDLAEEVLSIEHRKSEELLYNMLPESIAGRLKEEGRSLADGFESASILFADIVGFSGLSAEIPPRELAAILNDIFSTFDDLVERRGLEKIKTIGDAYMVAAGVPVPRDDHAEALADLALEMLEALGARKLADGRTLQMRIGINSGPVVAGVIGKKKFIYDLWGDTVNTASRMESHGMPGQVHVAPGSYDRLKDRYILESRGTLEIKGKGLMSTWFLRGPKLSVEEQGPAPSEDADASA